MKRTIVVFLALCGMVLTSLAQDSSTPVIIQKVKGNYNYYGFIRYDGTVVLQPTFLDAHEFSEGLAAVRGTDRRWGFVNTSGKRVFTLPANVTKVGDFSEGLCWFLDSLSDKMGYIDRTGKVVIRPQWGVVSNFSEGLAAVHDGRRIDERAYQQFDCIGYINHSGKLVIPINIEHSYATEGRDFSCGRAVVEVDDRVVFIDKEGNEQFGGKYRDAYGFSEGLCSVAEATNEPCRAGFGGDQRLPNCKLHWFVIDTAGNKVIDRSGVFEFTEGVAFVKLSNNDYILIDTSGTQIIERHFKEVYYPFKEGLAYVVEKDGSKGYIDHSGKMVLPLPKGYVLESEIAHGVFTIHKEVKRENQTDVVVKVINRDGETIWTYSYSYWFD